jgi:hypothetical protein
MIFFKSIEYVLLNLDCDDIFSQQSSLFYEGIFRIKPHFASESFEVKCIFENDIGKRKI